MRAMSATTTDDDNHVSYPMAAKALKVSRRTVERLVERGELERADGARVASVSRLSLVAALEQRNLDAQMPRHDTTSAKGLDGAALLAFLDQLREANERVALAQREAGDLRAQLLQIEIASADRARVIDDRDRLIDTLVNGSRRDRRAARRTAKLL